MAAPAPPVASSSVPYDPAGRALAAHPLADAAAKRPKLEAAAANGALGDESAGHPAPAKAATAKAKGKAKAVAKPGKAPPAKKPSASKKAAASRHRARARVAAEADYSPSPEPDDGGGQPAGEDEDADAGEDDRVYCICQQTYDPERAMIACDRCDEWYHLDCIHLNEMDLELISDFVCPRCEASTDARTSWKTRCAREGCHRAAVSLSKYCSDWCGIEVAALRLQRTSIDPARYWPVVAHVHRAVSVVTRAPGAPMMPPPCSSAVDADEPYAVRSLRTRLAALATQREATEAHVQLVDARLRLLAVAVRRWEAARVQHLATRPSALGPQDEAPENGRKAGQLAVPNRKSKKGKGKAGTGGAGGADDADSPCCFDVRLVWDDGDWRAFVAGGDLERLDDGGASASSAAVDGADVTCPLSRRQCDRHTGWQRLHEASFEAEKAGHVRKLDRLAAEERKLRLGLDELAQERERADAGRAKLRAAAAATAARAAGAMAVDVKLHEALPP